MPTLFAVPNPPPHRTLKRKPPAVRTCEPVLKKRRESVTQAVTNEQFVHQPIAFDEMPVVISDNGVCREHIEHNYALSPTSKVDFCAASTSNTGLADCTDLCRIDRRVEDAQLCSTNLTPRKQKLRLSINRLRVNLHRTKRKLSVASHAKPVLTNTELLTEVAKYVIGPAYSFIAAQVKFNGVRARGRRWDDNLKLLSLSLYYKSP